MSLLNCQRSVNSALPPIADAESVVGDALDRVAGFGPLQRYLHHPEIEEIWVNEPGRVFIARRGRSELTTTILGHGVRRPRRADAPHVGTADRHEHAVCRRDDAGRVVSARGHPRVHATYGQVITEGVVRRGLSP
jgi:Flp pilus assembly CpaF family ATPase